MKLKLYCRVYRPQKNFDIDAYSGVIYFILGALKKRKWVGL